jgi:hypothetical protein
MRGGLDTRVVRLAVEARGIHFGKVSLFIHSQAHIHRTVLGSNQIVCLLKLSKIAVKPQLTGITIRIQAP